MQIILLTAEINLIWSLIINKSYLDEIKEGLRILVILLKLLTTLLPKKELNKVLFAHRCLYFMRTLYLLQIMLKLWNSEAYETIDVKECTRCLKLGHTKNYCTRMSYASYAPKLITRKSAFVLRVWNQHVLTARMSTSQCRNSVATS